MKKLLLFLCGIVCYINLYSYNLEKLDIDVTNGWLGQQTNNGSVQRIGDSEAGRILIKKESRRRESYEDNFIRYQLIPSNGRLTFTSRNDGRTNSIVIDRLNLQVKSGNIDNNYLHFNSQGKIDLRVEGVFGIYRDSSLGGVYVSEPVLLKLWKNNEQRIITLRFYIDILRSLEVRTSPMYLGKGLRGEVLSSRKNGTPGILTIKGKPGEEVEIDYDKHIFIENENDGSLLKVRIYSNIRDRDDDEDEIDLDQNGNAEVKFNGVVRNTSRATSGKYKGKLLIKVRYD